VLVHDGLSGDEWREEATDQKRRFEDHRKAVQISWLQTTDDSVAKNAMLLQRKVSSEPSNSSKQEKQNFVQEENNSKLII